MVASTSVGRRMGFCGVDVGTQGVRAVIIDEDGLQLGACSATLSAGRRDGVLHEQDPESWWSALVVAVRGALAEAGASVEVTALALDATSGTVLVEDGAGRPRGPALMYDDGRAKAQAEVAQRVGNQLWDALGYRMQAAWALPKAMWLVEQGLLGRGDRVVHQSDHLVRRLVGSPVATDTSHALKSGVDLRDGTWPVELLAELGLDGGQLPEVVWPATVLGVVGQDAARATGLPQGTAIRAGMTDGCAAQIAAAALRPGSWSSALGTTLVVKGATRDLVRDVSGAVYCHRSPDGGWLPGGASSTGAGIIAQTFPSMDSAALDALTEQARPLVPVAGATYALAGAGERFPFVAPNARGFIAGEAVSDAARFGALCQSIAYIERLSYDVLGCLGADVSGPVSLSGGGSRNAWWNQLRTDVLGRATLVPESVEAATGMAVLAAAPAGELAATAERMVRIGQRYLPDETRGQALQAGYRRLLEALVERGWLAADVADRALAHGFRA